MAIEDQKRVLAEEVKKHLSVAYPDLAPSSVDAVSVEEAVAAVVAEKDALFAATLKTYERKEQKLRQTVEDTMSRVSETSPIPRRKSPSERVSEKSLGRRGATERDLAEIELLKYDWEAQKRQLDSKMSELSRMMPSDGRSQLSDSIFLSPNRSLYES
jgi:hypothetical protein